MRKTVFSRFLSFSAHPKVFRQRLVPISASVLAAFALTGCSVYNEPPSLRGVIAWLSPYKADIVQGNVVTTEQISQIKPGMTQVQVRDILGTPLITDPFHAQRWDYVFTLKRQGYDDLQRSFVVIFDKDAVQKIDAPELPTENEFVTTISRRKLPTSTPKLMLSDAERAALPLPAPVAQAASAAAPSGATRTYPALDATAP